MTPYDYKSSDYVQNGKPLSVNISSRNRSYDIESNETLASVVLINYNQGHYLEDALNSIINQTYSNVEIIVIDGGSIDNSKAILERYPGIKWVSEPDNSSGHAFAKGAERATGDIVYFLNSSDGFFDNYWIETSINLLRNNVNLALVSADVVGVNQNSILNGYKWPKGQPVVWENKDLFFNWLFSGTGLTPITFAIRKEVLRNCAPNSSQMKDPRNSDSVDFFWFLIGNFFNSGFIGTKIAVVSSFVRFHADRVDDADYLARQRNQLHRLILNRRRQLLSSKHPAIFISPSGKVIESESIGHLEIVLKFVLSKFKNILVKVKKDPFDID